MLAEAPRRDVRDLQVRRQNGRPGEAGAFLAPSAGEPGRMYRVVYANTKAVACPCRGFTYRGKCRHVEAVAEAIQVEQQRPAADLIARVSLPDEDPIERIRRIFFD